MQISSGSHANPLTSWANMVMASSPSHPRFSIFMNLVRWLRNQYAYCSLLTSLLYNWQLGALPCCAELVSLLWALRLSRCAAMAASVVVMAVVEFQSERCRKILEVQLCRHYAMCIFNACSGICERCEVVTTLGVYECTTSPGQLQLQCTYNYNTISFEFVCKFLI